MQRLGLAQDVKVRKKMKYFSIAIYLQLKLGPVRGGRLKNKDLKHEVAGRRSIAFDE